MNGKHPLIPAPLEVFYLKVGRSKEPRDYPMPNGHAWGVVGTGYYVWHGVIKRRWVLLGPVPMTKNILPRRYARRGHDNYAESHK